MKYKIFFIAALLCCFSNVATSEDYETESLSLIKNFYMWVIENESEVSKLEPTIVDIPGSTRFFLDTASLPKFASAFLKSGYFSKKFQRLKISQKLPNYAGSGHNACKSKKYHIKACSDYNASAVTSK